MTTMLGFTLILVGMWGSIVSLRRDSSRF